MPTNAIAQRKRAEKKWNAAQVHVRARTEEAISVSRHAHGVVESTGEDKTLYSTKNGWERECKFVYVNASSHYQQHQHELSNCTNIPISSNQSTPCPQKSNDYIRHYAFTRHEEK